MLCFIFIALLHKTIFMKLLPLFVVMILAQAATAQDFCKDIKKNISTNLSEFESPYNEKELPALRVKRTITVDDDETFDNFVLIFRVICPVDDIYVSTAEGGKSEKAEKAITIVFEDNSRITDDTVDIMHDITTDRTEAIRYVYYPIITETAGDFSSKKIAKFIIAGQEMVLPPDQSNAVMQYTKCIKAAK